MKITGYDGFFVLESMIYSLLTLVLVTLLASSSLYVCRHIFNEYQNHYAFIQTQAIIDVFAREILQAPTDYTQWKVVSPTTLIWHTNHGDYGWIIDNSWLKSIKGVYNLSQRTWLSQHKGIHRGPFKKAEFITHQVIVNNHKKMSYITLMLAHVRVPHTIVRTVAPRSLVGEII